MTSSREESHSIPVGKEPRSLKMLAETPEGIRKLLGADPGTLRSRNGSYEDVLPSGELSRFVGPPHAHYTQTLVRQ